GLPLLRARRGPEGQTVAKLSCRPRGFRSSDDGASRGVCYHSRMTFPEWFTPRHPQISVASAAAVLKLADEGATVPFIARYRKEETGNLDEVAIRQVIDAKENWDEIVKRQAFIVG